MKFGSTVLALALAMIILGTATASAVGYEKRYADFSPPYRSAEGKTYRRPVLDKLKDASFIEKCPVFIDEVAAVVKDILGQFGITERKAP